MCILSLTMLVYRQVFECVQYILHILTFLNSLFFFYSLSFMSNLQKLNCLSKNIYIASTIYLGASYGLNIIKSRNIHYLLKVIETSL